MRLIRVPGVLLIPLMVAGCTDVGYRRRVDRFGLLRRVIVNRGATLLMKDIHYAASVHTRHSAPSSPQSGLSWQSHSSA